MIIKQYTPFLKKPLHLSFAVILTCLNQYAHNLASNKKTHSYNMYSHPQLFHFYLLNFSYTSDTVPLCHLHVTAVFVHMALSDEDKILTKPLTSG